MSSSQYDPLIQVIQNCWDLGFTAFGGPPTHFQILHKRFVERLGWIDDEKYQELFALCQSLPGPASTKLLFCIAMHRARFPGGVVAFLLWSVPGAMGMYALAKGVSQLSDTLPPVVFALLSGLNAATVGIIAVAAFQLSERAITNPTTKIIVTSTGGAGILYKALWYFPVLMVLSGVAEVVWEAGGGRMALQTAKDIYRRIRGTGPLQPSTENPQEEAVRELTLLPTTDAHRLPSAYFSVRSLPTRNIPMNSAAPLSVPNTPVGQVESVPKQQIRKAQAIFILFMILFVVLISLRGALHPPPNAFKLFTNLFLAGTIIFGGGPVVIPLLRQYVVSEGWVSSRDFLIGLAIIQAFPGPNFNFAVYLAALTARTIGIPSLVGAFLGFVAIFFPGLALTIAVNNTFPLIRHVKIVPPLLRGVNAGAVGLIWCAVYRLWEIGFLTPQAIGGTSLGGDPWFVVVSVIAFATNKFYGFPPAISILIGGVLGIIWHAVTHR